MSYAGEPKCADCRHLLVVSDEFPLRKRGVCVICERMVGLRDKPHCYLFEPKVPQEPYIPPDDLCRDCRYRMVVYDEVAGRCRWVCTTLRHLVVRPVAKCKEFKSGTLRTPYQQAASLFEEMLEREADLLGKPYLKEKADYPRLLNLGVLGELRLIVYQFGELLKALELQPRVEHPHDPGGELARGQRGG